MVLIVIVGYVYQMVLIVIVGYVYQMVNVAFINILTVEKEDVTYVSCIPEVEFINKEYDACASGTSYTAIMESCYHT